MLHGDISNHAGITIGFRCEDFLIKYRDNKVSDKILNLIVGREKRAEVNPAVRSIMERLYRLSDYNVDLIIERKNYTAELKSILDDLPFCRVVLFDKVSEISSRLLLGDLNYYVDDDVYRRGLLNSKFAISLAELNNLIHRGVSR